VIKIRAVLLSGVTAFLVTGNVLYLYVPHVSSARHSLA